MPEIELSPEEVAAWLDTPAGQRWARRHAKDQYIIFGSVKAEGHFSVGCPLPQRGVHDPAYDPAGAR